MIPASFSVVAPTATARTRKPFPSSSCAVAAAVGEASASLDTTANAPFTARSAPPLRVHGGRLAQLGRRIERNELGQLRRVGDGLLRGGRADGGIHGVLPAVGARESGHRQEVRLVEAGLGPERGDRQGVERQRPRLVRAEHVQSRRLVHGGQSGGQHAQARQRLRAERRRQRERGGQSDRDGRQNGREHEMDDVAAAASCERARRSPVSAMSTPLKIARLRTTRTTVFSWVLTTWAVRTSSAVWPNFVRAPVAVTIAVASPRRTSAPA